MTKTNILRELSKNRQELELLLSTHLNKPEKVSIFMETFYKTVINGTLVFSPTWSWYAFFGGPFYFFYRKIYIIGAIIIGASFFTGTFSIIFSPLSAICLFTNIFSAVTAKYFYIQKFTDDLIIAGYGTAPIDEVIYKLKLIGGYNNWAIVLFIVLNSLFFIFIIGMFMFMVGIIMMTQLS